MTRDERRALFTRLQDAHCEFTGLSEKELKRQLQSVFLWCLEAKSKGPLVGRVNGR